MFPFRNAITNRAGVRLASVVAIVVCLACSDSVTPRYFVPRGTLAYFVRDWQADFECRTVFPEVDNPALTSRRPWTGCVGTQGDTSIAFTYDRNSVVERFQRDWLISSNDITFESVRAPLRARYGPGQVCTGGILQPQHQWRPADYVLTLTGFDQRSSSAGWVFRLQAERSGWPPCN